MGKAVKHKAMKKNGSNSPPSLNRIVLPPAYPFTGVELLRDLLKRLSGEFKRAPGLAELAQMMGRSKSTTHFWFSEYHHPQIIGLMTMLEHLSSTERCSFIEAHCRILPTLSDPKLSGATGELEELLTQEQGMTLVTGSTASARSFFLSAFGHSWSRMRQPRTLVTGIEIHDAKRYVPVSGVRIIDETLPTAQIRELIGDIWPRILTSSAKLALFNRLLSVIPESVGDLIRMAKVKHVVLAVKSPEAVYDLARNTPVRVRILTLAKNEQIDGGNHVSCRTA